MPIDIDKFVKHLRDHAFNDHHGKGKCGEYVRKALQAGGANFNEYSPPHYGKLYGLTLERLGFHEITVEDPDRFHFMRGDVMVMEPHKGGKQAGHVAGYDNGAVYAVTAHKCGGDDDAEETFEVHDPDADNDGNVPIPMLKALAVDFAARTVKAFGGADRLRTEIKAQRIDFNRLSPELQEAFKPYFGADK